MSITKILELDTFTPTLTVGTTETTSGYSERHGQYALIGDWVLAWAYVVHPSTSASSDFISIRDLPYHDSTVDEPPRAHGVWWHCSLLDGVNDDQYTAWVRMRTDLSSSYAFVNDSQGNEGRTSWTFSSQEVRLGLFVAYRVDLS